jgi:plasmid maintenance system killer protein
MKLRITNEAERDYSALSSSLQAKKDDEARDTWQGRVTRDYRFYFQIDGDTYVIITITKHPK